MDLIEMYPAAVNSKVTVTLGVLNADSTIIEVLDGSVLPDAPTLLVLGSDQTAETVKLTAKEGNTLTVERGIEGNAIAWPAGTQIARNFTAKDWNDLVTNVATIVAKIMGLSAADVHARSDTWMPTASDVGAVALYDGECSDLDTVTKTGVVRAIAAAEHTPLPSLSSKWGTFFTANPGATDAMFQLGFLWNTSNRDLWYRSGKTGSLYGSDWKNISGDFKSDGSVAMIWRG